MAYFSNHSAGSRFLAQTPPSSRPDSRTSDSSAARLMQQHQQHQQQQQAAQAPVPPLASRHFSTTVADEKALGASGANIHPLRNTWVMWFHHRAPGNKITDYEGGIKKISSFASVESFWSLWTHLCPPSSLAPTTDYLLFHTGVRRPVWEDPLNLPGGKWIVRLKKGVADRLWEDLVLALVGDQFDACDGADGDGCPELCGCTISVRQSEDIVSVWNRHDDPKSREKVRDTIRTVLNLPATTVMEYKSNTDSMQDKSSFRTTADHRVPLTPL